MKLNEINNPVKKFFWNPTKKFLEKNEVENYKINPDGTVDVNGNVHIRTKQSKLPVTFGKVTGYFDCTDTQLTSLEGVPDYIGNNFSCSFNNFTSLHDIHKYFKEINGMFYGRDNPIKDSVLGLLLIKGITLITLDNIKVAKILNKYLGQGRAGVIGAQQELLDAELDEYAKL